MNESVGNKKTWVLVGYAIMFIVLFLIPFFIRGYKLLVVNLILVNVILAIGYNFILGYAGQFSLAHTAFFGIGAYSSSLMMIDLGFPFWISMPLAGLIAAIIGVILGVPCLRTGGVYLAMLTFAFAGFIPWILTHWTKLTRGVLGLSVPSPSLWSYTFSTDADIYFLLLPLTIFMTIVAKNIVNSKIGRALMAIRDTEAAAESLGIDVAKYKIMVFALSAFYAGIAGCLLSVTLLFISPDGFAGLELMRQLTMVVIGGVGSILGAILGAIISVVFFSEVLREFKAFQEVIYGLILLVFVVFMPDGIVGLVRSLWDRIYYKGVK